MENIDELFVGFLTKFSIEKLRVDESIITTRPHPHQQEKNQGIIFIFFRC